VLGTHTTLLEPATTLRGWPELPESASTAKRPYTEVAARRLSYNCDTLFWMERAISIRLDDDAQHALRVLTKSGRSQSEAVREALIALARSRRRADLANEAERLNADRRDRAEKKKIAKIMESLRAAG